MGPQSSRPATANRSATGFGRSAALATVWNRQQVTPPLSGVKLADLKDEIANIFEEIVQLVKAYSGELLHNFNHHFGRDRASITLV